MLAVTLFLGRQLAALLVVVATSWALGEAALRRFGPRDDDQDPLGRFAVASTLGLGLLAQASFVLGLLGLLRAPGIVGLYVLAGAAAGRRVWADGWRGLRAGLAGRRRAIAAGALVAAPVLVLALYPPTGFDATCYHFPAVREILASGRLAFVPWLRYPVFPQVVEMGFAQAFVFAGDVAAQVWQVHAWILVAALTMAWGRRLGTARAGGWAAAVWLGTPLAVWLLAEAYVDLGLALFTTAALYCAEGAAADRDGLRRWALAGAFAGLAAGSKYLGLLACAAVGVLALVRSLASRRLRPLATTVVAATLALAPWYLRVYAETGNPVFPFYSQVFGRSEWTPRHDEALPQAPGTTWVEVAASQLERAVEGIGVLVRLPWTAVFDRDQFARAAPLSPLFLLLVPLALLKAVHDPAARRLLVLVGLYGLFWLTTERDVRWLAPVLPPLALAGARGLEALCGRRFASRGRELALAALLLAPGPLYALYGLVQRGPLPATAAQRDAYLARRVPGYAAIAWLNGHDPDATVYALYAARLHHYAHGRCLGDWWGPLPYAEIAPLLADAPALARRLDGVADYLLVAPPRLDAAGRDLMPPLDPRFEASFAPVFRRDGFTLFRRLGGGSGSLPRAARGAESAPG